MDIKGEYKFMITKDGDYYIAKARVKDGVIVTQGRNEEEIFMMVADAFLTSLDIKVHWWNSILFRLMKYSIRKK